MDGNNFGNDQDDIDMSNKASGHANIWRSYRRQFMAERTHWPAYRRALKYAVEPLKLRHVRNATFEDLSAAGYEVRTFQDGAEQFVPAPGDMPERWMHPQKTIVPKAVTLRDVELFWNGSVLLPDGNYSYFDTNFLHPLEENEYFGAVCKMAVPEQNRQLVWSSLADIFKGMPMIGASESDHPENPEIQYFRPAYFNRRVLKILDPRTGDALIRRSRRRVAVTGRCFSTRSNYPENMGHFMQDMLSRIYYEDLGVIAPGREKIIPPRFYFPMQKILFERIFAGYEILDTPPRASLKVEELVLPQTLCSPTRFNTGAIAALAGRLRRIAAPFAGKENRKICVSRTDGGTSGAAGRDFVNVKAYENRMREMGYLVAEISKLSPEAQFEMWANTTDIVGIHGAGLINMLMMPPGGNYTEITGAPVDPMPIRYCPPHVARYAMIAGHKVSALEGELDNEGQPLIDIEKLERIMRRTL